MSRRGQGRPVRWVAHAFATKVNLRPPSSDEDLVALRDLVGSATLLHESGQTETAAATRALLDD